MLRHPRIWIASRAIRGFPVVSLEYPVRGRPRWGYGNAPHARLRQALERNRHAYRSTLEAIAKRRPDLLRIPVHEDGSLEPCWANPWLPGLDTAALYTFITDQRPIRYGEVGSGYSTRVAHRAIRDHDLSTAVVSIDPNPRAGVDALCDRVIRQPLEDVDLALFDEFEQGDVLYVDGSHYCFTNSDATVLFLEVVGRLAKGVLVGVHDIFLPDDYPPEWSGRYYGEQYLLAAWMLGGGAGLEVVLPAWFVSHDPELRAYVESLLDTLPADAVQRLGTSFWILTT